MSLTSRVLKVIVIGQRNACEVYAVKKLCCTAFSCPLPATPIALNSNVVVSDVERIAQPVADEIEARHRDRNRRTRNDGEPGSAGQILLGAVEHVAPAGQRWLDPVAEKADVG